MKGYRMRKPSDKKARSPWSFWHMREAWKFLDLNTYSGNVSAAILCIGYFYGGRAGEYAANSTKDWPHIVNVKDLTLIRNGLNLKSILIDFRFHKTNKEGIYSGKVEAVCSCETGICPVHVIARYLEIRWKIWGTRFEDAPLLLTSKGNPVRKAHVNNLIKSLARDMNLDDSVYSSHSLRSGRATDLARAMKPAWFIKKWGRWRSECWQDFYVKLDFTDIARLSKLTWAELGLSGNDISFKQLLL